MLPQPLWFQGGVSVVLWQGIPLQHLELIEDIEAVDPFDTRSVVRQNGEYYFVRDCTDSLRRKAAGLDSLEGVPKEMICVSVAAAALSSPFSCPYFNPVRFAASKRAVNRSAQAAA